MVGGAVRRTDRGGAVRRTDWGRPGRRTDRDGLSVERTRDAIVRQCFATLLFGHATQPLTKLWRKRLVGEERRTRDVVSRGLLDQIVKHALLWGLTHKLVTVGAKRHAEKCLRIRHRRWFLIENSAPVKREPQREGHPDTERGNVLARRAPVPGFAHVARPDRARKRLGLRRYWAPANACS